MLAERVVVPAPLWVRPPVLTRDSETRAAPVLVAVKLVSVRVPAPEIVPLPRETEPTEALKLSLVKVPPLPTVRLLVLFPRAEVLLTTRVPAEIRLVPV